MRNVGLALGGGAVRGLTHIGVSKGLEAHNIRPTLYAGSSAGAVVAALFASGMHWSRVADLASATFWPTFFSEGNLMRFCKAHMPSRFNELIYGLAVIARDTRTSEPVILTSGDLVSALLASTALQPIRRPVAWKSRLLEDGGTGCAIPAKAVRDLGASFVIASDVWSMNAPLIASAMEMSSDVRADLLIQPIVPILGLIPTPVALRSLIAAGERATYDTFLEFRTRRLRRHPSGSLKGSYRYTKRAHPR